MNIRRARREDYAALAGITASHDIIPSWSEAMFIKEEENSHAVTLVAEIDGRQAGFINFWVLRPETEINMIAVSLLFLRRKVASSLMKKMREYAKKSLCKSIILDVRADNSAAISFYEKEGFLIEGKRPKFYNDKYDAMLMRADVVPQNGSRPENSI